jgi:hypothetical protein
MHTYHSTVNVIFDLTPHMTPDLNDKSLFHVRRGRTDRKLKKLKCKPSHTQTPDTCRTLPSVEHFAGEGKVCIWVRFAFLLNITLCFSGLVLSPSCH